MRVCPRHLPTSPYISLHLAHISLHDPAGAGLPTTGALTLRAETAPYGLPADTAYARADELGEAEGAATREGAAASGGGGGCTWRWHQWLWWSVPRGLGEPSKLSVRCSLYHLTEPGVPTPPEQSAREEPLATVDVPLWRLPPHESTLFKLSVPLAAANGGSGGEGGEGGSGAADTAVASRESSEGGSAVLTLRLTYRPHLDSELPVDQYGFQVGLQHVISFRNVRKATGKDGTMWLGQWNNLLRRSRSNAALPAEAASLARSRYGRVPLQHRPHLWMCLSGARSLMLAAPASYWDLAAAVESGATPLDASLVKQIDSDLPRTFPQHRSFANDTGLRQALRRVLLTYSAYNVSVGYCQSLNFIVAAFLLVADEEGAFWLLVATCRSVVADYHTREMSGLRIDTAAFASLVATALPNLHKRFCELEVCRTSPTDAACAWARHRESAAEIPPEIPPEIPREIPPEIPPIALQVPIEILASQWWLCLYANVLPTATLLRTWDAVLSGGGVSTLVASALALLRKYEVGSPPPLSPRPPPPPLPPFPPRPALSPPLTPRPLTPLSPLALPPRRG